MKKIIYVVIVTLLIIIGVIIFLVKRNQESGNNSNNNSSQDLVGKAFPIEGSTHVSQGSKVSYNSNPPTSGDHWPQPAEWGIYLSPLPDEQLVHNLEHGAYGLAIKI